MEKKLIDLIRISVPESEKKYSDKAEAFFDILPNSTDLTEEFLYSHLPTTGDVIPIFSTSELSIGKLDDLPEIRESFNVISGPVIVVARKGYAGHLYVVNSPNLIVHEDAYAIKPKQEYIDEINLSWFAEHYDSEFQSYRTSMWGIGDFPRERFKNMNVIIPSIEFQNRSAELYLRKKELLLKLNNFQDKVIKSMDKTITELNS